MSATSFLCFSSTFNKVIGELRKGVPIRELVVLSCVRRAAALPDDGFHDLTFEKIVLCVKERTSDMLDLRRMPARFVDKFVHALLGIFFTGMQYSR